MDDLDFGATIRGFSAGQRVFQRFVLERILGRGGMGVVWLAHDEKLDEPVALKFLPEVVKLDAVALGDLRKETKRARQLTHPNIVRIHDLLEEPHMAAIAMEAVDGTTLSQLRMERPAQVFGVAEISGWLPQLAAALDYAHHDARVVHRDLKPANIMLDRRGRLKVTDFGVSQSLTDSVSRASAQKSSSGTPAYMSPQQMLGERAAPTDDIYALGATVYELLTGKPPFHSGNIILQVQSVTPPPMAQRRAELEKPAEVIPPEWETAIAACLDKSAARRPRSAGELLQRLGLAAGVAPVEITDDALPVAQPEGAPVAVELDGAQRLEFLPVPAGEFVLGSPAEEPGRYEDESPRTQVRITRAFWLGKAPISHAQWRAVMGSGLIDQVRLALEDDREYSIDGKNQTQRAYWGMARDADPARMLGPEGDDVVMHYVSWEDAREFCRRLTERERAAGRLAAGLVFDLPTEAEWEYACRAGTRTATPAGPIKIAGAMNAPVLDAIAWYGGNSSVRFSGEGWDTANWKEKQYPGGSAGPRNVGLKRPNPWGLHDMLGNTWEWCLDLYAKYPGGVVVDPIASGELSSRVCRGGAWNSPARDCRAGARNWLHGGVRRSSIGFRVALVAERTAPMPPPPAPGETSMADTEQYPSSPASGRAWRVTLAGGTVLPMRWMPPGDFVMGSPEGEAGAYDEEGPRLEVRLTHGFWLGRTPVTQGQWRAVMGGSPKTQVAKFLADTRQYKLGDKQQTLREYWELPADTDPGSRVGDELSGLPMYYVTWSDAMDFCAKLTEMERAAGRLPPGYEYTLPTEAQWEYACRAGTTAATYAGDIEIHGDCHAPVLDGIAWYSGNSSVGFNGIGWDTSNCIDKQYPGGRAAPRLVAAKEPNAWGLHDMLGNVWEWCFDGYWKYPGGKVTDPVGNPEGATRISRGGAWNGKARDCRAACRNWTWSYLPNYNMGFRVALAPVLPRPAALPERAGAPAAPPAAPPTIIGGSTVLRKEEPRARDKFLILALVMAVILALAFIAAALHSRSAPGARTGAFAEPPVDAAQPAAGDERRENRSMEYRAPGRMYVGSGAPLSSARHITWSKDALYITGEMNDGAKGVVRARFQDYGAAEQLFAATNPHGIAVGPSHVFWVEPDSGPEQDTQIWHALLDGSREPSPFMTTSALPSVAHLLKRGGALALRDNKQQIALIAQDGGAALALSLTGGTSYVLVDAGAPGTDNLSYQRAIASDKANGFVYTGSADPESYIPAVMHLPRSALTATTVWSGAPLIEPFDVTCVGGVLFISDPAAGAIWCCPLEGGPMHRLVLDGITPTRPAGLTSSDDRLYLADAGDGSVYSIGDLPSVAQLLYGHYAGDPGIIWENGAFGYLALIAGAGGTATSDEVVTLRYIAYLSDGTVVGGGTGSRGLLKGKPENFGPAIATGLKLGGKGAKMRLLVPPRLGSSQLFDGTPPPPRGAGVIVDLEIVDIRSDK